MSEFRLWIRGKIARLDGTRERRFVALATALIFASLALGPQALRAVDFVVNTPDIVIDPLGTNPLSNPVRFRGTTLNVLLGQVAFLVTPLNGTTVTLPGHLVNITNPSLWESENFEGVAGQSYVVNARGFLPVTGTLIESSQSVAFSIFNPTDGSGTSTPPTTDGTSGGGTSTRIVEIFQIVAWPGTEPKIETKGLLGNFIADSAYFRVQSLSGLAFLGEYDAELGGGNTWQALFAVPGGSLYQVTLVAREAGISYESLPREIAVPVADAQPPTVPTPPLSPPHVFILLPSVGPAMMNPIPLAARVSNATATSVTFEVLDPAGVTRALPAGGGTAGEWTAMFFGEAGQYSVGARAFLNDGSVIPPTDFRSFSILASATNTETPAADTAPTPPPTTPVIEPIVELFSPPATSEPFVGAVPISVRVRNGLPEKVVAIVTGPTGGETIVIASKSPTGDFWTALFEGPDGEYRFRMRALVGGKDVFSPDRPFAIKRRIAATLPPPPQAPAPPAPKPETIETEPPAPTRGEPPIVTAETAAPQEPADSPTPAFASIPETLTLECRAAGILPVNCADWLKTKYQSRECLDAGAVSREACAALLKRRNIAADETNLFGLVGREALAQAREDVAKLAGESVRRDELPASIAALLPVVEDTSALVRLVAVANANDDSSPAILVFDADGDGLPDDVEKRFGTDLAVADTDGDGFSDGMEVRNGYNPLGSGSLERPLRGVEKALLEGLPLEEPRGAETLADPSFTIAAEEAAPEADEEVIRLSGKAAPNSIVTIFVYSYLPIVVTTTTDENGNWTYDFGSKLAEGRHEAYVSVNDDTGKLVATSSPLAFFVKEAQAVSEADFLRPDVNVEETHETFSRWFVYGGIGLVALALILVIAIARQTRKTPMTGSSEGL